MGEEQVLGFLDELGPFLVVYWKNWQISAFSGIKSNGCYIFQLFRLLEVTGCYRQWGYIRRVFGGFLDFSQEWTWKGQRYTEPGGVDCELAVNLLVKNWICK